MAALLTGQSVNSVAREFDVPKGTVSYWKKVALNSTLKRELEPLLTDYLITLLKTLICMAREFSQEDWLKKDDAYQVGICHKILFESMIKLLEQCSRANTSGA